MPSFHNRFFHMAFPNLFLKESLLFSCLGFIALAGGLPVSAQDQPSGQQGTLAPGSLNYQKAQVSTILDLYERLSGKHLIKDVQLDGVNPITLDATGLSPAEALKMIEETLLLNGVTLIPVDDKTVKVVTVGANKNPRSEGPKLYANAADLPTDDQVVSYYMQLDYIPPQEAAGIFLQVSPAHQYGGYVPAPSAQAVVLTENVSVIRQLIALKELIDAPPARVATEWIQLNRADSDETATLLNKMLGIGPNGAPAPSGPNGSVIVPADLGNKEPLSNEHNLISGTATIISDPRSNRLLVITRPVNLPYLEEMIGQLDQSSTFQVPQRRPLKYVLAADILPALEAALAQGKDEEDQLKKDVQTAQTNGQNGNRTGGGTQQPVSNGGGGGTSGGSSGSQAAITPQLQTPTENDVPSVLTVGKTRLMADNRSNSVIVFGSPDVVTRVFNMIDQLDRKPLQVYLATVIGELTVKQGLEFGIDILQNFQHVGQGGLASGLVTPGTTTSAQVPIPQSLTSSLGFPLPTGLTLYGAIGSTLSAYVRALDTTNRFKVISHPAVFTENNKLAVIASGSQIPVPSSTTSGFTGSTTDNGLTTTSSISYESVLLQLDIIPLINADHEVTLQIRQTNNTQGNNVNISGNEVPIIDTQEINTTITVPNKSTVVIGGLITDNTSRDTSGVPWLGDIPILGYLFKDTTKNKERDELIIMIQPSVIETDADLVAVNEEEKQRTILGQEAEAAAAETHTALPHKNDGLEPEVLEPAIAPQIDTSTVTIRATNPGSAYNSKSGAARTTTTTTTTTTVQKIPTTTMTPLGPTTPTGPVPAVSSPAPDVSNGQMPKYPPGTNPSSPTTTP
jgi:general secretion pathway protein D